MLKVLALPTGDMFLERDLVLLRKHFKVRTAPKPNYRKPIAGVLNIFKILKGTLWADVTFSQFADSHAFFAVLFSKILRKRSIVVVGGYEVARIPEIGYGAMLNPVFRQVVRFILKHADRVLTTSESLKEDAIINTGVDGRNIKTVYEGYDAELWKSCAEKEKMVLTVATVTNKTVIRRKGLETFIKAAGYLPMVKFVLVGKNVNKLKYIIKPPLPNVEFHDFIPSTELPEWYSRAKVYCQLSLYEGIPNALCEAMLCECIPVGTNRCGIPLAMGETGFYVPYRNIKATVEAVKRALVSNKGNEARERIKLLFPIERRERELTDCITSRIK